MKRLFIGLPVYCPDAAAQTLSWQNDPALNGNRLAWTRPSNWHLTLAFLGATPDTAIPPLCHIISQAFDNCPAFTTSLTGAGVFPNRRRPTVLWLGLQDFQPLLPSYSMLAELLGNNKFPFDQKTLKPHLTIARIKNLPYPQALDNLLLHHHHTFFGEVTLNCITLYESISTTYGVRYVPLYEKRLK